MTTTTTIAKLKRIIAVAFVLIFCFTMVTPALAVEKVSESDSRVVALKEKVEAAKKEAAEAKKKRAALESEMNEAEATASQIQAQVNALQAEISAYQNQINALNAQITAINTELDELEAKMITQEQQIASTQELLGQRLRAMYMAGNVSTIEILFEAGSFEDLINRVELVSQITKHDSQIIEDLKEKIADLQAMQEKLEEDKVTLQESKEEIIESQTEIKAAKVVVDKKLASLESYLSKLSREDKQLAAIEQQAEEEQAAYSQTIYNMIHGIASSGTGSAKLICPVPYSSAYVSSAYGTRTLNGRTSFHYGIDITLPGAMNFDKRIIAAGDGTVLISSNACSHNYRKNGSCGCNSGYGNYCVIDHGNGVIAYYAHLTKSYVSVGQKVSKGDTVGIMGCTGYSTGAHLHFEIRVNTSGARTSTARNPLNYISVP